MSEVHIVPVTMRQPDDAALSQAAGILRSGGLVVAPTETRYGLLGRADRAEVVNQVLEAKGRPADRGMAVFVASLADAERWAVVNRCARALNRAFLPGPLTLILKAAPSCPSWLEVAGKVGVRVSSAPVISSLLGRTACPLTATSANRSGSGDLESVGQIREVLGERIDLYLDAGVLSAEPSTVVDCSTEQPVVLRRGSIPAAAIRDAMERFRE